MHRVVAVKKHKLRTNGNMSMISYANEQLKGVTLKQVALNA
jgi:hypothetical protein